MHQTKWKKFGREILGRKQEITSRDVVCRQIQAGCPRKIEKKKNLCTPECETGTTTTLQKLKTKSQRPCEIHRLGTMNVDQVDFSPELVVLQEKSGD